MALFTNYTRIKGQQNVKIIHNYASVHSQALHVPQIPTLFKAVFFPVGKKVIAGYKTR